MDHSDVIEFFLENRPQLVNQANAVSKALIFGYSWKLVFVSNSFSFLKICFLFASRKVKHVLISPQPKEVLLLSKNY